MPRRSRRHHASQDEGVGLVALVVSALIYHQISALTGPWKIALVVVITSIVGTAIIWIVRSTRRRRRQQLMRAEALNLTPAQFEERIQLLLHDLGWERVERVGSSGDGGVDLRGIYRGERWIVQCKRYAGRVEPTYLRDLEGARSHERADRALLVTTGRFTPQGYAWVRGKPIELWDGTILAECMEEQRQRLQDPEQQRERQHTRWLLGSLASLNALVLLWAAISAPVFVPSNPVSAPPPDAPMMEAQPVVDQPVTASEVEAPESCGTATISGVERLVLRAAPGLQSEKLANYPAGTVVMLACEEPITADGLVWQQVHINDQEGWMSQRMLR